MTIHKSNLQQLTQPDILTSLIQRKQINKPQYRAQGQSIILRTTTRDREITFYATTSTTAKDMQSAMASELLPGYNYRVIVGFVCFTFHCENQVKGIKTGFTPYLRTLATVRSGCLVLPKMTHAGNYNSNFANATVQV